jgi:hypothetical protein
LKTFEDNIANQLLFTDPETGEELRLKYEPRVEEHKIVLYVTNKSNSRNWKHTIKTEETI